MVFAVLVGFVNESVTESMENLNKGTSKIAASEHTLLLGCSQPPGCEARVQRKVRKQRALSWEKRVQQ